MSNLECIGLVGESEQLFALVDQLIDQAKPREGASRYWQDASGALLAVHGSKKRVDCMTPYFAAFTPTVWPVRSSAAAIDAQCRYCSGVDVDVLDESGEMLTRTSVQLVEFAPYEKWLAADRRWSLEVVAFAHTLSVYPDEESFAAEAALGEGSELKIASSAFMPMGLFGESGDMGERARVLCAGRIVSSVRRRNTASGHDFLDLVIESHPGRLAVAAPASAIKETPQVGHLAKIDAWLVGRPTEPPPVRRRILGLF